MDGRKLLAIYIRALRACNERRGRREVTQFAFTIVPRRRGFGPLARGPRACTTCTTFLNARLVGLERRTPGTQGFHHPNLRKVGARWGPRFRPGLSSVAPTGLAHGWAEAAGNIHPRASGVQRAPQAARSDSVCFHDCAAPEGLRATCTRSQGLHHVHDFFERATSRAREAHAGNPGLPPPQPAQSRRTLGAPVPPWAKFCRPYAACAWMGGSCWQYTSARFGRATSAAGGEK